MTVLTKADRASVQGFALRKAFADRFLAVRAECEALLQTHIAVEHPQFVKLLADPDTAPYVARLGTTKFRLRDEERNDRPLHMPRFWRAPCLRPETRRAWLDGDRHSALVSQETAAPALMSGSFDVTDPDVLARYWHVWSDLAHADEKMTAVLAAYKTREKLAEDFPDIAAWLPPIERPAALPAVIPATERAALHALGVL